MRLRYGHQNARTSNNPTRLAGLRYIERVEIEWFEEKVAYVRQKEFRYTKIAAASRVTRAHHDLQ